MYGAVVCKIHTAPPFSALLHRESILIRRLILALLLLELFACRNSTTEVAVGPPAEATPVPTEPPASGRTMKAWELWRDPMIFKGKTVMLDPVPFPVVNGGQVMSWQGSATADQQRVLGWAGLSYFRTEEPGLASYDVGGIDAQRVSGSNHPLGRIAVTFDTPTAPDARRTWVVSPLRLLDAKNALGGTVSVPLLKFWRYASDPVPAPKPQGNSRQG